MCGEIGVFGAMGMGERDNAPMGVGGVAGCRWCYFHLGCLPSSHADAVRLIYSERGDFADEDEVALAIALQGLHDLGIRVYGVAVCGDPNPNQRLRGGGKVDDRGQLVATPLDLVVVGVQGFVDDDEFVVVRQLTEVFLKPHGGEQPLGCVLGVVVGGVHFVGVVQGVIHKAEILNGLTPCIPQKPCHNSKSEEKKFPQPIFGGKTAIYTIFRDALS